MSDREHRDALDFVQITGIVTEEFLEELKDGRACFNEVEWDEQEWEEGDDDRGEEE
jgi:hypothetical protein